MNGVVSNLSKPFSTQNLDILDANIYLELDAIQAKFKEIDLEVSTGLSNQLNLVISEISDDFTGAGGFLGGVGAGGALAAALLLFTPIGIFTAVAAAVVAAIAGVFGFGMMDVDGLRDQIKVKVFELGFQKFEESVEKVHEKLGEIIGSTFDHRVDSASRVIAQAIALYEHLLEQQEKAHATTLEQREQQKDWITQRRKELEQVEQSVETVVCQY